MTGTENHKRQKLVPIHDQIFRLESEGIRFDLHGKRDAEHYLSTKCNFFKILSYRAIFTGSFTEDSQFNKPDFAQLRLLASIDQRLRHALLGMTLDLEHISKVLTLQKMEKYEVNEYAIVTSFLETLDPHFSPRINQEIQCSLKSPYNSWINDQYHDVLPVWAFLELVSFGTLRSFVHFCASRWDDKQLRNLHYDLKRVNSLRNAAAHGSCIINSIVRRQNEFQRRPSSTVNRLLAETGISKARRRHWMKNHVLQEIVTVILLHNLLISEGNSRSRATTELKAVFDDLSANSDLINTKDAAPSFLAALSFLRELTERVGLLD